MEFISDVAEAISWAVSTIGSVIFTILNVNFVVLSNLISTVASISTVILDVLKAIGSALLYAAEDFQEFVSEICGGISAAAVVVVKTVNGITSLLALVTSSIIEFISRSGLLVYFTVNNCVDFLKYIVQELWLLIVLISKSIVMLLQFPTQSLSFLGTNIINGSQYILRTFVIGCNQTTASIIHNVKAFGITVSNKIQNIPVDAYIGLLIIIVAILAQRFMKHKVIQVASVVSSLLVKIFQLLGELVCVLSNFIVNVCRFVIHGLIKTVLISGSFIVRLIHVIIQCFKYMHSSVRRCIGHLNAYSILFLQRLPNLNNSGAYDDAQDESDQDANESVESEDELEVTYSSVRVQPTGTSHLKNLQNELEEQRGARMCIICLEQPKNIIFLPCRHLCVCQECAPTLIYRRASCPLCRQVIRNTIHVYT